MLVVFWSAKGGAGVTVAAASTALVAARQRPTVLLDLGGDAFAALGLHDPIGPGAFDWLDAPTATADGLFGLGTDAADGLRAISAGTSAGRDIELDEWQRIADASASCRDVVVVDAGRHVPSEPVHARATRSFLVTRACFLGLRRAAQHSSLASAAVLIIEPGRALTANDVERALGVPVAAELSWDPAVARAVDAGLLSSRMPSSLVRQLREVVRGTAA
jgi:hypothetical protein